MTNDNLPTLLTNQPELLEFVANSLKALSAQVSLCFKEETYPGETQLREWESMLLRLAELTELASKL
ncbi:hypothetical protein [Synechococcus sp. C9]|uniref:hypothetical protein n=1 Tax=Synechococcus sp. C9 TaxID=102119 RepID=UPI001FF51D02|nr:hypothetical protein [Synechococcus sp. C9]